MRRIQTSIGEHYHVYNHGNDKQLVFLDERDQARFLFLILYLQSAHPLHHITSYVDYFKKNGRFNVSGKILDRVKEDMLVEVVNFVLMPSYFHLTLREKSKAGISRYMHKILVSYSKYFNSRHRRTGHLFAGTFRMNLLQTEQEVLHLSAQIHKSPKELPEWRSRLHLYPWSSYQDYLKENRFNPLLSIGAVRGKFETGEDYKKFVDASKA
ncbi:MAG: transposase [bacterium]|nr:transposase [bacterium]